MQVLVIMNENEGGCTYYRQRSPHLNLADNFQDVHVTFAGSPAQYTDEELIKFDLIQYHKGYIQLELFDKIKKLGIPLVVDFDDYWDVPPDHVLWHSYKQPPGDQLGRPIKGVKNHPDFFRKVIREADYVTTSTALLSSEVARLNKNVYTLENAIYPGDPQVSIRKTPSERVRIGWIGGSCHLPDIQLLRGTNTKLSRKLKGKYEFTLFGYHAGVGDDYMREMTDGYQMPCNRVGVVDVFRYMQFYNYLDIALVPLTANKFNSMKSELKLIEAGFFKKPVVVSNVYPYKPLLKHMENALVVNKQKDWERHLRYLIENPDERERLGQGLYDTVKDRFNQTNVSKKRYKIYKEICSHGRQLKQQRAA